MWKRAGWGAPEEVCCDMWKTHRTTTQSLREFDRKNLIHYFITPKMNRKQMKAGLPAGDDVTTWIQISHKQPACWRDVHSALCAVLGYVIPKSCLVLYRGHLEGTAHVGEQYLVKIVLTARRKADTKNCLKTVTPSYKQWLIIIGEILVMEHLNTGWTWKKTSL